MVIGDVDLFSKSTKELITEVRLDVRHSNLRGIKARKFLDFVVLLREYYKKSKVTHQL